MPSTVCVVADPVAGPFQLNHLNPPYHASKLQQQIKSGLLLLSVLYVVVPLCRRLTNNSTLPDTVGSAHWGASCPRQGRPLPPFRFVVTISEPSSACTQRTSGTNQGGRFHAQKRNH